MNLSEWLNFPTLRVIDCAYLLAGLEPRQGWDGLNNQPAKVTNYLQLIECKTGAVVFSLPNGRWERGPIKRDNITQAEFQELLAEYGPMIEAEPPAPPVVPKPQAMTPSLAPVVQATETKEQRQDRRLQACEMYGLVMPKSYLSRLPDGVGDVAGRESVTRQAFSTDVKAALKRREIAIREGRTVHRA